MVLEFSGNLVKEVAVVILSDGTLTTLPWTDCCCPHGKSLICMKTLIGETSLSSSFFSSNTDGLSGNLKPLATDKIGILLFFND